MCSEEYQFLLYARAKDRAVLQNGKDKHPRACLHTFYRLDADSKRYGTSDLPSPWIFCSHVHGQGKVYGVHFHNAEHRRKPRRNADSFRKSAESLSLLLLQYPHGRVYADNAFDGCYYFNYDAVTINVPDSSGAVLGIIIAVFVVIGLVWYLSYSKKQKKIQKEIQEKAKIQEELEAMKKEEASEDAETADK